MASCSKEVEEPDLVTGEARIYKETGIAFSTASEFTADYVVFKLRHGTGEENEYGQSLSGYNYTKLQEGARTIYQIQAFNDGEEVSFEPYLIDAEGNKKDMESTSVVVVKKNEVVKIWLEKTE